MIDLGIYLNFRCMISVDDAKIWGHYDWMKDDNVVAREISDMQ